MRVPRDLRAFVVPAAVALVGCVHFNAVYNAGRSYNELDRARRLGIGGPAHAEYREVIERARRGLAANPEGKWADDALLLIGRSHLRRREYVAARERLREVIERSDDQVTIETARLYLGALEVLAGEPQRALSLLSGIEEIQTRLLLGEGHLWRARALLRLGRVEAAWRELEAAKDAHPDFRPAAELIRFGWAITTHDTVTAFSGLRALLDEPDARFFGDSVRTIIRDATGGGWTPEILVSMLDPAEDADWSRRERDRLLLLRARLAWRAGLRTVALSTARQVAGSAGDAAAEGRLQLARWRLEGVEQLAELGEIRGLLLPAVASEEARMIVNDIRRVEHLVDTGLAGEALAFFAAAERARETLGASTLAASLFLAFVDLRSESPWAGKALLAARDLSSSDERREAIRMRLRGLPESAYVRYARTGRATEELAALEERLQSVLTDILGRVEAELRQRRLLVQDPEGGPGAVP